MTLKLLQTFAIWRLAWCVCAGLQGACAGSNVNGGQQSASVASTKYIMWIPGRAGSTWTTELLAESHPQIRAEREGFSKNHPGCQEGGSMTESCLRALDSFWTPPNQTNTPVERLIRAKGFKVRPLAGWVTPSMLQAYADRGVRFVCNTRVDTFRHAISMYRHPLSRNQTTAWDGLLRRYGNRAMNGTRVHIPSKMLSDFRTTASSGNRTTAHHKLRLPADCTVMLGEHWGHNDDFQDMWLARCQQNMTFQLFDKMYARANKLMKAVFSLCMDYTINHHGAVHWLNYEKTQAGAQTEVDKMADFIFANTQTNTASPDTVADEPLLPRHKTTATELVASVPNIMQVVGNFWKRVGCAEGFIADVLLPLNFNGTGSVPSAHSIKSLLFGKVAIPVRHRKENGSDGSVVVIGSGVPWIDGLFSYHPDVNHAVVAGSDQPNAAYRTGLALTPKTVRCDGGCDSRCHRHTYDFLYTANRSAGHDRPNHHRGNTTVLTVNAHSLNLWNVPFDGAVLVNETLASQPVRFVCAIWENAIEGGLARLHYAKLSRAVTAPRGVCTAHGNPDSAVPDECLHRLEAAEFRAAVNAVAIETFSTLRFCRSYATAVGADRVIVVSHRPDTGRKGEAESAAAQLNSLAAFAGIAKWTSTTAERHLMGSYQRFFPGLTTVLQEVLHAEVHSLRSPEQLTETMCLGCDAYSVMDTLSLLE